MAYGARWSACRYEGEKRRIDEIRRLTQRRDEINERIRVAEARRDLAAIADLKFGALPELESRLRSLQQEKATSQLLAEVVRPEDIARVVSRWTGIPVERLSQSERSKLLDLEAQLKTSVVGQDEAVSAVAQAVLRGRAGLAARDRGSSFLFLGPTGVGKTELAKSLARLLFDDERMMIRIDMGEPATCLALSISASGGAASGEEEAILTRRIPHCRRIHGAAFGRSADRRPARVHRP